MSITDQVFVNEDLSKLENRINVATFGLFNVDEFREWFLSRFEAPREAVIYPPATMIKGGGPLRPDFKITVPNSVQETVVCYVEVECDKDHIQLENYRQKYRQTRVHALWGRKEYVDNGEARLSLEEVLDFLVRSGFTRSHTQQGICARYLRKLILRALSGSIKKKYPPAPVSEEMKQNEFVAALLGDLGATVSFQPTGPFKPGQIRANTRKEDGFSLRVYSPKSLDHTASLLNITSGQSFVYFQSAEKLMQLLPERKEEIITLVDLVRQMGGDMISCKFRGKTKVPQEVALKRVDELGDLVLQFTQQPTT
jgi:hypothetical protein